jgi:hypothetical protein
MQPDHHSPRARPLRGASEADIAASMRVVKTTLDDMRREGAVTITVVRLRPTRNGWAVIYREGEGLQKAFWVDARNGVMQVITPEGAVQKWMGSA